jgi:hypothetical protein
MAMMDLFAESSPILIDPDDDTDSSCSPREAWETADERTRGRNSNVELDHAVAHHSVASSPARYSSTRES